MLNKSVLILFMLCATAWAQEFKSATLPETPAAEKLEKFITVLKSGDHETFIKENFSDRFLDAFPMEAHLDFFRQVATMHGGFNVHSILESTEHRITVIAQSERGRWRRISIETEPAPPFKVAGMDFEEANPPGDMQKQIPRMTEKEILDFTAKKLKEMAEDDTFSGAVLIAKNGKPIFEKAVGMANKSFDVPNTIKTKFNIGSINKSFTELAIAQLLEKGKIDLDDTIGKYLSDFPPEIADKVTIRHLLTMRSGMGGYWNDEYWSKLAEIRTVDDLIDIIKKQPLDFEPGTSRQYSNSGFVVLGAIIESVTGESYYEYVRKNIYEPAGMENTDSYELDQIVPNLAVGYTRNRAENPYRGNKLQNNIFIHAVKGSPAGGGYSTVGDLLKYVNALENNELAGPRYTSMVLDLFQNADRPEDRPMDFGIAGGAPVGINAVIEADFKSGYTVIVLSNYDPPIAETIASEIYELLRNRSSS